MIRPVEGAILSALSSPKYITCGVAGNPHVAHAIVPCMISKSSSSMGREYSRTIETVVHVPDDINELLNVADGLNQRLADKDFRMTKSDELLAIEAEHGFVFGGTGESDGAPAIAAVVCGTPNCPNMGHHVQIHTDTPQPVHCGGCGTVLLCDHAYDEVSALEGTLTNPVKVTSRVCAVCGDERDKTRTELPAVDLASLPASAFAAHLG